MIQIYRQMEYSDGIQWELITFKDFLECLTIAEMENIKKTLDTKLSQIGLSPYKKNSLDTQSGI